MLNRKAGGVGQGGMAIAGELAGHQLLSGEQLHCIVCFRHCPGFISIPYHNMMQRAVGCRGTVHCRTLFLFISSSHT